MQIQEGSLIPDEELHVKIPDAVDVFSTIDYFANSKVVMFSLPGAFTPICTKEHVPGYVEKFEEFKNKGVNKIACLSVNDAHVMKAWADHLKTENKVDLLADPHGKFSEALGLLKSHGKLLGMRARRSALIAVDGQITHFFVEKKGAFEVSKAEYVLSCV